MKHIKTFEAYQYLNERDTEEIKRFITNFFDDSDFNSEISNLNLSDFIDVDFDYREIFDKITSSKYYTKGNIYYEVDTYCKDNKIHDTTPAIRNTVGNILDDIYKKYKKEFENELDNKLIEILESKPEKYKKIYSRYSVYFNYEVKTACKWMLAYQKYNL